MLAVSRCTLPLFVSAAAAKTSVSYTHMQTKHNTPYTTALDDSIRMVSKVVAETVLRAVTAVYRTSMPARQIAGGWRRGDAHLTQPCAEAAICRLEVADTGAAC
jgi:hypothetical protein